MENKTYTKKAGQARGNLMRLERDLNRSTGSLASATRNRIVGGVMLLIGLIALIGRLATGSQFYLVVLVVALVVGSWMFVRARAKIGRERHSIGTMTDRVTHARTELAEAVAQVSAAE